MNDIERLFEMINCKIGKDMFDEFIINLLKSNLLKFNTNARVTY